MSWNKAGWWNQAAVKGAHLWSMGVRDRRIRHCFYDYMGVITAPGFSVWLWPGRSRESWQRICGEAIGWCLVGWLCSMTEGILTAGARCWAWHGYFAVLVLDQTVLHTNHASICYKWFVRFCLKSKQKYFYYWGERLFRAVVRYVKRSWWNTVEQLLGFPFWW